ncbi:Cro/CI family transcriptional regulator [Photobacterium sp. 1_MG-2023]|uniref:Cro/CI family transcriptional regulator n=1 Tax=Photobacterium sp. 1_MG-2023 TaxID=3062646 RepID=UPI0026E363DD|nr:Cro/CI family transcriptional regulator [Photobacterium sp. 1_MG-2023]MDO6706754.1 Cro/CI family transcriptional regulator [Photobacterium sp. 1_MG-2023]
MSDLVDAKKEFLVAAIQHFKSQKKLAEVMKVTPGLVSQWKSIGMPDARVYELHVKTKGKLKAKFPFAA